VSLSFKANPSPSSDRSLKCLSQRFLTGVFSPHPRIWFFVFFFSLFRDFFSLSGLSPVSFLVNKGRATLMFPFFSPCMTFRKSIGHPPSFSMLFELRLFFCDLTGFFFLRVSLPFSFRCRRRMVFLVTTFPIPLFPLPLVPVPFVP